jgi:hypothetical protein
MEYLKSRSLSMLPEHHGSVKKRAALRQAEGKSALDKMFYVARARRK